MPSPKQAHDSSGVEIEPLGKHFGGVLAEQWRRLNGGRDAIEVVRARDDHRSGFAVAPQNHVEGRLRRAPDALEAARADNLAKPCLASLRAERRTDLLR